MGQLSEIHEIPVPESESGASLLSHLAVIWQRKWTVLVVLVATVGFGVLYCFQWPAKYRSTVQILLIKKDKIPVSDTDRAGETRSGSYKEYGYEDTVSTHMLLIASPRIVRGAATMEIEVPVEETSANEGAADATPQTRTVKVWQLDSLSPKAGDVVSDPVAYVTQKIIKNLKPSRTGERSNPDPNVMELSYDSSNPEEGAAVLKAIVLSYEKFLNETYKDIGKDTVKLVDEAKDKLYKQIKDTEDKYSRFRNAADSPTLIYMPMIQQALTVPEARVMEIEKARAELMVDLAKTKSLELAVNKALAKGSQREAITLLVMRVKQEMQSLPSDPRVFGELKLLENMADEQQLKATYGPDHPKVKTAGKNVDMMRQHFGDVASEGLGSENLVKAFAGSLKEELAFLEMRKGELDELFQRELKASRELADYRFREDGYRKEMDRNQQMFDAVMKRLDVANLVKDYGGISMQLLSGSIGEDPDNGDGASPADSQTAVAQAQSGETARTNGSNSLSKESPTARWQPDEAEVIWPKPVVVLILAMVLGMGLGVGVVYLIEFADRSFRTPEDVQGQLGLPIFGHIPFIAAPRSKKGAAAAAKEGKAGLSTVLCTVHSPKGRHAEAYRAVRTALYFGTKGEDHKVIQVTSPSPGDGKTTLAANLAISIADSGKRVLLIDADFRRPKIDKYFGITTQVGMSSLIAGDAELPDVVQQTPVNNLWVIPCGARPDNPGDLLTSSRFEEFIEVVREQYDFVLIDSPPLLAVTDPAVIAPRVDGVLFVIRLSKHARDAALRAIDTISTVGGRVLGVVVNGLGKTTGYGYGKYGYGGYRHGRYQYSGGYGNRRYGYGSYGYGYGYRSGSSSSERDDTYYSADAADITAAEGTEGGTNGKVGADKQRRN